ncbi:MAG: hypothetical protein CM1200mP22_04310 [Dehalococcoidia bacterium]|nr:MAG: hypothetical protein CM1200mP22_04310 [Dehalococcoidia bacterium]
MANPNLIPTQDRWDSNNGVRADKETHPKFQRVL